MKKLSIIFILALAVFNIHYVVKANLLQNFEELTLENPRAKLIHQYNKTEINQYLKKVQSRKIFGWNTFNINTSEKANFKQTTIMSIRNSGTTPIVKEHSLKKEVSQKYALSASNGLESTLSGNVKDFKLGLSSKLNIKADATINISQTETMSTKIQVDPKTQLDIYVMGSGRITNGVAAYYLFFIRVRQGSYEYMNINSLFYRMEKKRI